MDTSNFFFLIYKISKCQKDYKKKIKTVKNKQNEPMWTYCVKWKQEEILPTKKKKKRGKTKKKNKKTKSWLMGGDW